MRLRTSVERIDRDGDGWVVRTSAGDLAAPHVVVATGYLHAGHIPEWPGRDRFGGTLLHAAAYRNPAPYEGRDVLVVGPGCTGMEIAYDLAEGGASARPARRADAAEPPPPLAGRAALREGPGQGAAASAATRSSTRCASRSSAT